MSAWRFAGASAAQRVDQQLEPFALGDHLLAAGSRLLAHPLEPPFRLLQIRQVQLRLDCLRVGHRVQPASRMRDGVVGVRAHHVTDRVGLADLGEEAVAEPLALGGAAHEARDVVELDRLRDDGAGARRLRDGLQAVVRNLDDRDVRFHRRKRVGGRLGRGPGQGVEQGGLAGVWKTDDADLHVSSYSAGSPLGAGCRVAGASVPSTSAARRAAFATRSIKRSSIPGSSSLGTARPINAPRTTPARTSDG